LPDETLIDGELLAVGSGGKLQLQPAQNLRSAESHIIYYYYAFDILNPSPSPLQRAHDLP
jgi:hypothetical protein